MDSKVYVFLYITLDTSLSIVDLTPDSQNLIIFTPTTSGISYAVIALTVILF